jgi:hypothetical protein
MTRPYRRVAKDGFCRTLDGERQICTHCHKDATTRPIPTCPSAWHRERFERRIAYMTAYRRAKGIPPRVGAAV